MNQPDYHYVTECMHTLAPHTKYVTTVAAAMVKRLF